MKEKPGHEIKSPFTVTPETQRHVLLEFGAYPNITIGDELRTIADENVEITTLLNDIPSHVKNKTAYFEGALFTHMAIRTQVEMDDGQLPRVSRHTIDIFMQERTQKRENKKVKEIVEDDNRYGQEAELKDLLLEERILGNTIKEVAKYNTGKVDFYRGASDMYSLLKTAVEVDKLEKMLGGQ